jgi:photosystem II stability/assembly factor-like uncharacterized protein
MNQRGWLLVISGLACACAGPIVVEEAPAELAAEQAPLRAGQLKTPLWKPWHRHHHKPWQHCPGSLPERTSCAWSDYDTGLSGAAGSFVFFDPRVRGLAYAVSGGKIWQSTDSGETWSARGDADAGITRLAVAGTDPAALVAATTAGLKVSTDSAATWATLALSGLPIETLESPIVQPQRVYANIDTGPLLLSTDAGEHWSVAGSNYPRGDTFGLSVDPRSALDLVAALQFFRPELAAYDGRGAIFRTLDGGITWQSVYDAASAIHELTRCPTNPDVLLAATREGIARSRDNGATWTLSPIASATQGSLRVAVDPHDCDDYYALQANQGPRHTRDGGASFSAPLVQGLQLTATGSFPGSLAIDPEDVTHLILSTHGGFYVSHDSGEHWSLLPLMVFLDVTGLAVSPQRPSEVWLTTWGQGVWKRSHAAADWERIGIKRLPRDYVAGVSLDPAAGRALIGANPPLFSGDGESFSDLAMYSTATSAAFHPSDPGTIYVTTQIEGVLKSEDGGQSWRQVNGNLPRWATATSEGTDARSIVINPGRTDQLFVATWGHGIYRSDDAAATWSQVLASTESATCLVLVPQPSGDSPRLYACLSGVSASADGGTTWQPLSAGLPSLDVHQLVHDSASGRLYASSGNGVFVLAPGAEAWRALDPDCEATVRGMALMEEDGQRYLVVGAEHGVRRLTL